jgi:ParB family chromosome partitioning protein
MGKTQKNLSIPKELWLIIDKNLDVLREELNPLERARAVQDLIDHNMAGLRAEARKLGISPSTLSDWTSILKLTPEMQKAVGEGKLFFLDARRLAYLKPGELQEERLAEVLESGGRDAYVAELQKLETGAGKRGAPAGKYVVVRVAFERRGGMEVYDKLATLAKAKNMELDEYVKWVLTEHTKTLL